MNTHPPQAHCPQVDPSQTHSSQAHSSQAHSSQVRPIVNYVKPTIRELIILLSAVICCYCILYGPQVLINRWVTTYSFTPVQASALIYVTLIPMSIAPLSYGVFLGMSDTRMVMIWALSALACMTALLYYTESYMLIMVCRFAQGVTLPAILTAIMVRLSSTGPVEGPRLIIYYLCATVIGGLLGRLVTGYYVDFIDLHTVWWLWAGLCMSLSIALLCLPSYHVPFNSHTITRHTLKRALKLSSVPSTLLCVALMFGGFAAALNLLPFRADALDITAGNNGGSVAIAHRYWGYLAGVIIALQAQKINHVLGGKGRAPALGLLIMAGALLWGTLSLTYAPLVVMVLGLCIGLFITHPLLTAYLTQLAPSERGLMSGLYVSSYYIGGASCSWLAGLHMKYFGWERTLTMLALMLMVASWLVWFTLKHK